MSSELEDQERRSQKTSVNFLRAVAAKPLMLLAVYVILSSISSYQVSQLDSLDDQCSSDQLRYHEMASEQRHVRLLVEQIQLSTMIIDVRAAQLNTEPQTRQLDARLRKLSEGLDDGASKIEASQKQMEQVCKSVGDHKLSAILVSLLSGAIVAIYAFWAGSKNGTRDA